MPDVTVTYEPVLGRIERLRRALEQSEAELQRLAAIAAAAREYAAAEAAVTSNQTDDAIDRYTAAHDALITAVHTMETP